LLSATSIYTSFETILRTVSLRPDSYISNPYTLSLLKEHEFSEQCARLYHLKLMASSIIAKHNELNENKFIDFISHDEMLLVIESCGMSLKIKNRKIHNDEDKIECVIDWISKTRDVAIWDYSTKTKLFYLKNDDMILTRALGYVERKVADSLVIYAKLLEIEGLHTQVTKDREDSKVHIQQLDNSISAYKKAVGSTYKKCTTNLSWRIKLNRLKATMTLLKTSLEELPKTHKRSHPILHLDKGTKAFKRYQLLVLIDHLNLTLSTDNSNLLVEISRFTLGKHTGLSSGTIGNMLSMANFRRIGSYEEVLESSNQDTIIKEKIKYNNSATQSGHFTIGKRLIKDAHLYYLVRVRPNIYCSTKASILGKSKVHSNEVTRVTERGNTSNNNAHDLVDNNISENFMRVIHEAYSNTKEQTLCIVASSKRFINTHAMASLPA